MGLCGVFPNEQTAESAEETPRRVFIVFLVLSRRLSLGGCLLIVLFVAITAGCSSSNVLPAEPVELTLGSGWQLQDVAKVRQGGEVISQVRYPTWTWMPATVPGTVLTSLVNDGVYPEPLYGENDRPNVIPDSLCRTSYWYRTTFTPPTGFARKHIWLNFAGINYVGEVWVNGQAVGSVHGAFARGIFDVTKFVSPGKPACIAVRVIPPPHPGVPHEHTVAAGTGGNGGILSEDGPTFLCTLGWDWMPAIRDRDIGIWRNVTASASGAVVLRDSWVSSDVQLPSADLTVQTTAINLKDEPCDGLLHGELGGERFETPVKLKARETKIVRLTAADIPQLHLQHPSLVVAQRLWTGKFVSNANLV